MDAKDCDPAALAAAAGLPRPRAVIFDWDNTLVDSWHVIQDAQNHTLVTFGLQPWTLEETRQRVRGSMRDTYPQLFGSRWKEAGEVFYRRFAERQLRGLEPLPGAEALLRCLREQGVYLAVVSNKKGDYLRKEADHMGWSGFFGRIVGAFDAARDKPAPDPVHLALEGSGIGTGDGVWFLGDADIDLECAINAGCVPVLIRTEAPAEGEFGCFAPAAHFDGCMTLSNVLGKL